jgi:hypothetical protein
LLIGDKEYTAQKSKLRTWLKLEQIKSAIYKAVENKEHLASKIISYISTALGILEQDIENEAWYEIVDAYVVLNNLNSVSIRFPISTSVEKYEKAEWDYEERTWYVWLHLFAKNYSWNSEYVANLEIEDGIALLQEILVDNQLQREWEWGLTEMAYPYNQMTKKSEFKPLNRPSWMQKKYTEPKKVKIPIHLIPMGNVITHKQYETTKSS